VPPQPDGIAEAACPTVSAGQRSLRLRSVGIDRIDFELVVNGYAERLVSVLRDSRGRIDFPHMASDAGEPLGGAADEYVCERAREEFVRLDGYLAAAGRRRTPSLEAALAYLDLLAEQKPEKLERAVVRWHGRLETEAPFLTLAESQLALAALASLCAGERESIPILRRLLRRARPTLATSADV
jgi:hypothetical protein